MRQDDNMLSRLEDCEEPPPVQMSDCLDIMEQQKKRLDKTFRETKQSDSAFFVSDKILEKAEVKERGDKWGRTGLEPQMPERI